MISRAALLRSSLQRLTVQARPARSMSSLVPDNVLRGWYNTYVRLPVDRGTLVSVLRRFRVCRKGWNLYEKRRKTRQEKCGV